MVVNILGGAVRVLAIVCAGTVVGPQPPKPVFVLGLIPDRFLLLLPAASITELSPLDREAIRDGTGR